MAAKGNAQALCQVPTGRESGSTGLESSGVLMAACGGKKAMVLAFFLLRSAALEPTYMVKEVL